MRWGHGYVILSAVEITPRESDGMIADICMYTLNEGTFC